MKKHPIDELFAKKLAEHRQEPSQKAFEKFQARLQEKQTRRRGGVFAFNRNWGYYAAAAGVVAALTIGILSQRNTDNAQMAVNTGKPKVGTVAGQPASPSVQGSADVIANTQPEKVKNIYDGLSATRPAQEIAVAGRTDTRVRNAQAVKEIVTPVEQEPVIALNKPEDVSSLKVETLAPKNTAAIGTFNGNNTDIASKYSIGRESVVLIIAPVEENVVKAPAETESSLAEKAEKEKSFLAKLYGEYKHFKYGEKVDLKGLGVKDAVARVDESLFKEEREDVRDFVQRRIGRMQRKE